MLISGPSRCVYLEHQVVLQRHLVLGACHVVRCLSALALLMLPPGTFRSLHSQKLSLTIIRGMILPEPFELFPTSPRKERNTRKEKTKTRRATYSRKNRLSVTLCTEEVGATIFSAKNIKISNDRLGLTRSAILLVLFIVIHAVGNLHVFKGQRLRIWMVSVANSVGLLSSFSQFLSVSHASPVSSLNLFLTVFAAASVLKRSR